MDFALVVVLYVAGLGLVVAESMMPGIVIGLIGTALLATSVVFGFRYHWAVGTAQIALALVVCPLAFYLGLRRFSTKASLAGATSFGRDYSAYVGREGEALTDLRPAGMVVIEGEKLDVVTSGELVPRGRRVRVAKVEGNRVVVKAI